MQILVVSQDAEAKTAFQAQIETLAVSVLFSETVDQTMQIVQKASPGLIVMDVKLSEAICFELAQKIRALGEQTAWSLLLLWGSTLTSAQMQQAIELGIDDFMLEHDSPLRFAAKVATAKRYHHLKEQVFDLAHDFTLENKALENLASQDPLTGLINTNGFEDRLEHAFFKARQKQTALSLLLLDLDHFSVFNDQYDQQAGDQCIKKIVDILKTELAKQNNVLARKSGVTFAIILPNQAKKEALKCAERLRKAIYRLKIPNEQAKTDKFITASIGVAQITSAIEGPWELLEAADYALYQAKHGGRNQVQFAGE